LQLRKLEEKKLNIFEKIEAFEFDQGRLNTGFFYLLAV
jgi:hypothetical protein